MGFYSFLKYFHSGFRYVVIILMVIAILQSLVGWFGKKPYTEGNRKTNMVAMIMMHTQLLIGLVLYFKSPLVQFSSAAMKNSITRYYTAEHISMMLIAIVLVTVGHARSKRVALGVTKHKTIAIFYLLGMLIISVALVQMMYLK